MTKLPSSRYIETVLTENGFRLIRQRGSHIKFSNGQRIVVVPAGRKEIPIGTFKSIIRQSGLPPGFFEGF
jgi:predicted RNA binding protein YcfA (HicA-like mRNA interferase family)